MEAPGSVGTASGGDLGALTVCRKWGTERFHEGGRELPFDLLGFWQWSASDLVGNALRGMLAEYLVACDLGVADGTRVEWDAHDLQTRDGVKVEVKSAAYLQSWRQERLSAISFGIPPTFGWDASTNTYGVARKRQADVYVFALLKHLDKRTLDPLDVEQWTFYVLPTVRLDRELGGQKTIGLARLLRLEPAVARFGEIAATIARVCPHPGHAPTDTPAP